MNDEDFEELEDIQEEQKAIEAILRKKNPRISKTQILEKNPRYKSLEMRRRFDDLHSKYSTLLDFSIHTIKKLVCLFLFNFLFMLQLNYVLRCQFK